VRWVNASRAGASPHLAGLTKQRSCSPQALQSPQVLLIGLIGVGHDGSIGTLAQTPPGVKGSFLAEPGVDACFVRGGGEFPQSGRPSRACRTAEAPRDKRTRYAPGVEGTSAPSFLAASVGVLGRPPDQSSPLRSSPPPSSIGGGSIQSASALGLTPSRPGGPRAGRAENQGGAYSPRARRIFPITSSWAGDVVAARIFISLPHVGHRAGFSHHTRAMRRAQVRRRTLRSSLSFSTTVTWSGELESFLIQPKRLRIVVESPP